MTGDTMRAITTCRYSRLLQLLLLCTALMATDFAAAADSYDLGLKIIREQGFKSIDPAIDHFRNAVKSNPSGIQARMALADALIMKYELSEKKDVEWLKEARAGVEEVLKLKPGHSDAYFSMANVLLDLGREDEGAKYLKKAVLASPEDEKINAGYFSWLLSHARTDDAVRFAAESEKIFNDKPGMFRIYGEMLLGAGRPADALHYLTRIPAAGTKDCDLELLIADALRLSGKYADALARYEVVLKSGPGGQRALFGASCCHAETGNLEKAAELMQQHLAANSADAAAMNNLAILYEKLGRNDEAGKLWKKLIGEAGATPEHKKRADNFFARQEKK